MNRPNIMIIVSSMVISLVFFWAVMVNLDVRRSKEELEVIKQQIEDVKLEIRRANIEIASLTSPEDILSYIEKRGLKPVERENIEFIYIKKELSKAK